MFLSNFCSILGFRELKQIEKHEYKAMFRQLRFILIIQLQTIDVPGHFNCQDYNYIMQKKNIISVVYF